MKDHQLGNPSAAAESARLEEFEDDCDCVYWDGQNSFALGVPNRILEAGREALTGMLEAIHGETAAQREFREGDHQPDGEIREGVTDREIIRNVNACMSACTQAAQLREYSMGLVDRLTPLRSRELVGHIQKMAEGHAVRIRAQHKRDPASIPAANPFAPLGIAAGIAQADALAKAEQAVAAYENAKQTSGITFLTAQNPKLGV